MQYRRGKELGDLDRRSRREWAELYGLQGRQREELAKDFRRVLGRFRLWREERGGLRKLAGALRGSAETLGRHRAELEQRQRRDRVELGKAHYEVVRGFERAAGDAYRTGMEGSEERAEVAARTRGWGGRVIYDPPVDHWKLRRFAEHELLEQVREIEGEKAYEQMRQDVERASQPRPPSRFLSRDRPQHRGPERSGSERDHGPSR